MSAPVDRYARALGFVEGALRRAVETGERPSLGDVRRILTTIEATVGEVTDRPGDDDGGRSRG